MADEGVDEQAQEHPCRTAHHCHTTTNILDDPEATNSGDDVDGAKNDRSDVRVLQTGGAKDDSAVVEKVVGASELLTGLEDHTEEGAVQHTRTSEDLVPGMITASFLSSKLLLNLADLVVDESTVGVDTVETSHVGTSLVNAAHTVGVTGRFGQKENRAAQNDGP